MIERILPILWLIFYYFKAYVGGVRFLIQQICSRHRKVSGIPLQTGKVAIVTGGAAGIGYYVTKGLVAKNVHVIIGGKSIENGQQTLTELRKEFPNAKVDFFHLDLASLRSVRAFADTFLSRELPLHILINNAGVMFPPYRETEDGYESQLQINYLSHFYLIQLLLDKLKETGTDNSWSRIINVSSSMHHLGNPDLEKLAQRCEHWYEYSSHASYCDSKLAIVASSNLLDKRLRDNYDRVSVCAVHPGVVRSNLWNNLSWFSSLVVAIPAKLTYLTAEQGADTILYAAVSPEVEGQSGCYYDNSRKCKSSKLSYEEEFQTSLWTQTILMIENSPY